MESSLALYKEQQKKLKKRAYIWRTAQSNRKKTEIRHRFGVLKEQLKKDLEMRIKFDVLQRAIEKNINQNFIWSPAKCDRERAST